MFTGCSDEDEIDVCERPNEAREIVSDAQIERFQEAGVDFHCGDRPPSLEGSYQRNDGFVEYHDDEDIIGASVCSSILTIEPTEDESVYSVTSELTSCSGESTTTSNYVSGKGDCFTLYNESEGTFEGCEQTDISILSGCIAEGGIEDPRVASLATRREGDVCDDLYEQGRTALEGQIDVIAYDSELNPRIHED